MSTSTNFSCAWGHERPLHVQLVSMCSVVTICEKLVGQCIQDNINWKRGKPPHLLMCLEGKKEKDGCLRFRDEETGNPLYGKDAVSWESTAKEVGNYSFSRS